MHLAQVIGTLVSFSTSHPFILTLGMLTLLQGVALLISNVPISELPESYLEWVDGHVFGLPLLVVQLLNLALINEGIGRNARASVAEELEAGERILVQLIEEDNEQRGLVADLLQSDYGLRQLVAAGIQGEELRGMLQDVFTNLSARGDASFIGYADDSFKLVTATDPIAAKVAPCIAAGNTMILKPSEECPSNAVILAEILEAAGVPAGVFNLVQGDGPGVGAAIAAHPGIDMVSFTGSTRAGIAVAQAAAPTVKRVHQELGGKGPNLVLPGADLEAHLPKMLSGVIGNSVISMPRGANASATALATAAGAPMVPPSPMPR